MRQYNIREGMHMVLRRIADSIRLSARELTRTRSLAACAMLLAVQVILGSTSGIPLGESLRVSIDYLALCLTVVLFGPVPGMINGALADLLGCLLYPSGPFFPGFTLTGIVSGLIYGLILYRREPLKITHFMLAKLAVMIVCNILMNTFWVYLLYGKAFWPMLITRTTKNLIEYGVSIPLFYALMRLLPRVKKILSIK